MKHDLQEAWRFLRANRGFAAVVILTLGLAIGVNSTPSFFVNGTLQKGAMSFEEFDKLLKPMTGG